MSVIPLTIFFSLLLAGLFVALFVHERRGGRFASAERDSLLPLADEVPHPTDPVGENHSHAHGHGAKSCGCRKGTRPPCAGCRRRLDEQDPVHF